MATKATGMQSDDLGAKFRSSEPTADDSFVRHATYFFKDGNITFLVDGTLYCVHRYFFSRDSAYFSTKFGLLDVRDHEPLNTIISLGDVEQKDFEAFLSIIYPINFEEHGLSYGQWKSVLHLSTRWGFTSLRNLALSSIKPPTPFDRLLLARTYNVDHWILPALTALCERKMPTTLKEARQMSIEDVVLIATVRDEIRGKFPFRAAEIERRIEVTQVRMVAHIEGDDVSSVCSESGVDENAPPKEAGTGTGVKADRCGVPKEVAAFKAVNIRGSDEQQVETAEPEWAMGTKKPGHSAEDEWAIPTKAKKGHSVEIAGPEWATPTKTKHSEEIAEDEWAIPGPTKKKQGHTVESAEDEWAIPVRTKKKK